ncbi:MAG: DNA methyltransferase, partial [Acidobacteriota bacterium]
MSAKKAVKKIMALQRALPFPDERNIRSEEEPFNIEQKLSSLLKQDLTFKGEKTSYASHNIHAFAARFPPQIPRIFIQELTRPGEIVLDPMCGSGTTLIEAMLAGRHAVGVDLDPLACLVARVKSSALDLSLCARAGEQVLRDAEKHLRLADDETLLRFYSTQAVEFFRYWFTDKITDELFALVRAIKKAEEPQVRAFLKVVFS